MGSLGSIVSTAAPAIVSTMCLVLALVDVGVMLGAVKLYRSDSDSECVFLFFLVGR
jgi:hypothetical protein